MFLTHNFGYRYASKSMKGSIDADFDLVFNKTLSQKSNGLGPRASQRCVKFPKNAFFVTSPPEIPPPKSKIVFFSILTTRLAL